MNGPEWLGNGFADHPLAVLEDGDIEIPGAGEDDDLEDGAARDRALRSLGKRLAKCFGTGGRELAVDHLVVERRETVDEGGRDRKEYHFRRACAMDHPPNTPHSRIPRVTRQHLNRKSRSAGGTRTKNQIPCSHAGNAGHCGKSGPGWTTSTPSSQTRRRRKGWMHKM